MYFAQFFNFDYWFAFPRPISLTWMIILLAVFGALFIGGVLALMLYPKIENRWKRQVIRHSGRGASWIGLCGALLVFARNEFIPVFMLRFWFVIVVVWLVVWAIQLYRYAQRRKEKLDEETRAYQTKQKYLTH